MGMSDQPQHNPKARGGQETPVLLIRDLPYLQVQNHHSVSQVCLNAGRIQEERSSRRSNSPTYQAESFRGQLSLFEERNGDLASDDAEVCRIGGLKELVEDPFFFRCQVEVGMSCYRNSGGRIRQSRWFHHRHPDRPDSSSPESLYHPGLSGIDSRKLTIVSHDNSSEGTILLPSFQLWYSFP